MGRPVAQPGRVGQCRTRRFASAEFGWCWPLWALLLAALLLAAPGLRAQSADAGDGTEGMVVLHVFWSLDCPVCIRQKPWLEALPERFAGLELRDYELSRSDRHHALFTEKAQARDMTAGHVPTLFLNQRGWVGDSAALRSEIEAAITAEVAPEPQDRDDVRVSPPALPGLPPFLDAQTAPTLVLTLLIGTIDGVNPCSLWVLTLLLGLVIQSGSRRRVAVVGLSFLTTTALIYGAFIAGVFGTLQLLAHLIWVRWVVAGFALVFGLVAIKDYVAFGRGISFSIPQSAKPGIYRRFRALGRDGHGSLAALIAASVVMAAGIALVELPCTAGFPVVWSALLAERGISGAAFWGLLGVYVLVYLLIELAIFAAAIWGLRMGRLSESGGRLLKLLGGAIMVALAAAMILAPELMSDVAGSLKLFALALALALGVHLLLGRRLMTR